MAEIFRNLANVKSKEFFTVSRQVIETEKDGGRIIGGIISLTFVQYRQIKSPKAELF